MKILKIKIKNFRSIKKAEIALDEFCAIVGKNNVGKSSILRALNSFFNYPLEAKDFLEGNHTYSYQSTPQIEIVFDIGSKLPLFQSIANNGKVSVLFKFLRGRGRAEYFYRKGRKYETLSTKRLEELLDSFHFVMIPAFRDHQKIHELENSILRLIILRILQKKKRNNLKSDTQTIVDKFKKIFSEVETAVKGSFLLEKDLDIKLDFHGDVNLKDFLSSQMKVNIIEQGRTLLPKDCGTGIQNLLLITLFKYHADLSKSNYLLAIEEPETNLHPQAQLNLMDSLKALIKGDCVQMILTSHSPHIIDYLDHTDVVLCQKSLDGQRVKTDCYQLSPDYWTRNNLVKIKNDNFFKYKNSDFFYADRVIICEGVADSEVVMILSDQVGLNLALKGVTILTLDGVNNLNYPLSLVKDLNIPYLVILDKDFFLPYRNGKLLKSRNINYFPIYGADYHPSRHNIISKLIPNAQDRLKLKGLLNSNHSKAMDLLQKYDSICFKWNLETDLVNSKSCRYEFLKCFSIHRKKNIDEHQQLLDRRSEAIKDHQRIISVVKRVGHTSLPNSYKRIKKVLSKLKKN